MNDTTIRETLGAVDEAMLRSGRALNKAITEATGLVAYDLQPGALKLYPVLTPLRNSIPRVAGNGGTATNWKAITGINTAALAIGLSEGNRAGVVSTATQSLTAAYKGLGLEDYVTFEADYAAQGFDDVRQLAVEGLLRALMIGEERVLLGGNSDLALGQTPVPSPVSDVPGGGTLSPNTQYSVICVALTLDGYLNSTVAAGVTAAVSRTNADGSVDSYGGGVAQVSANATVTTANDSNSTHALRASVAAVKGAFAYAWYLGAVGAERLCAITTVNSAELTAANPVGQLASSLPASDNSRNGLVFDGLLTQICAAGSNAYYAAQATGTPGTGTPLTSDDAGGIVEIDAALKSFWDNYRLSPTRIWVNSQEQQNITRKILSAGAASSYRVMLTSPAEQGVAIGGGALVTSYQNKFAYGGAQTIPIALHPFLPPGTVLFTTDFLPYPLSNVANVLQVKTRRDYYQLEWPLQSRRYEYGVYVDEVLQNYFPPAFGIITNIANG